ncbi:MAG: glycogen synthase GlgA [Sporolactobacillus sp.]
MNVLLAASECVPFIKTGGLGDVVGALPKALGHRKAEVSIILPKYEDIPSIKTKRMTFLKSLVVPVGWRKQYCGIYYLKEDGVTYYFLDNEYYFKRRGCYGYYDDGERFAFFSRAVLEALPHLSVRPPDIIHCHDWQTGPICALLKSHYFQNQSFYQRIHTVFTIHNLQYQGVFPRSALHDLLDLDEWFFQENGLEFYGNVSYMKAGLAFADRLTTVSRAYAEEIQMPYYGEKLDGFLRWRSHDLHGIVNGIDQASYDPLTDAALVVPILDDRGKKKNKLNLQKQLRLTPDESVPMIGMITRLANQKGIDLVLRVFHEIAEQDAQFVLLGTGDQEYEQKFNQLAARYPKKVSCNLFFDESLARKIYAASDLFLMPSKFEPCGIGQLLALRYGSLPIVRETGGLKDTVIPYNEYSDEGYGFTFTNYNAHDMLYTIKRALNFYREDQAHWKKLVDRALRLDFGWDASAKAYSDLYQSLIEEQ